MLSYKNKQLLDLMFGNEILACKELKVVTSRALTHKDNMIPIRVGDFLIRYCNKNNCDYLHIKGYYMFSTYLTLEIKVNDVVNYVKLLEN